MQIRLIGDLHGHSSTHIKLARRVGRSIQIGDCGFNYGYLPILDPLKHKIVGGNHENYDTIIDYPHYLGDFGIWNDIFFVRGAYSIDKDYRLGPARIQKYGKLWWEQEELTYQRGLEALDAYVDAKPNIVVSHECPFFITQRLHTNKTIRTRTGQLLEAMYDYHQPKIWFFGHYHMDFELKVDDTIFRCIRHHGGYLDIETEDYLN